MIAYVSPYRPPQGEAKPRERVTSLLFHLGGGGEQYGYMLAETVDVNIDLLQQLYLYVMKELLTNFKLVYRQFQRLIFHCKYRNNCLNS